MKGYCGYCRQVKVVYDQCTTYSAPSTTYPDFIVCAECLPVFKAAWMDYFKRGRTGGDRIKSRAEIEAAVELGLQWDDTARSYLKRIVSELFEID